MINKTSILLFLIISLPSASFSQLYKNDLERCNLKGNVKMIYYKLIHFHEEEIFDSHFNSIGHDIYVYFNKKGNIVHYGGFEDEILKSIVLDDKNENENLKKHYTFNSYGKVIESTVYFTSGFYKNNIKNKQVFEYDYHNKTDSVTPFRISEFKTYIDTTNEGREVIYLKLGFFSDKEHTYSSFIKEKVSIYNKKKQLVKRYFYNNTNLYFDGYSDANEEIYEYKYDDFGNIIWKTKYSFQWFDRKRTKIYEYSRFDKNSNWIQKSIICDECIENKVEAVINREITYWEKD